MNRTRQRTLLGTAIGHAAHDTWYGVAPVLLATLSAAMQLSNSEIGLVLLLYQAVSSVTQPFFGRLAERVGGRSLAVASILWTTLMFSGTLFAQSKALLALCIALAGFGSGAWHPQGAANAAASGGAKWAATATSLFFFGGTLGTAFLGAALGGYLLSAYGRPSLLMISFITVSLALLVVRPMIPRKVAIVVRSSCPSQTENGDKNGVFWVLLALLLISTALRSLSSHSLITYIPKYQQDLGISSSVYGLVMSLFLVATAIGGVCGSYVADRIGTRSVLAVSMTLAGLLFLPFVRTEGIWSYLFLVVSGLLLGPSHTLLLVAGQRRFPQRAIMVTGIFLGFNFVSGAGGAWVFGLLADKVGLRAMLGVVPWTLCAAALLALVAVPRSPRRVVAKEDAAGAS